MINKVIGIADIHIPNAKGLDDLKGVAETFYDQARKIVKETGGPENVRIVVGGDLFDMKLDITNEGLLAGHEFLQALDKICPTIVIAGNHDLNLQNLGYFIKTIPWTDEVSIGHAIICDALYMGLEATIKAYLAQIKKNSLHL